MMAISFRNACKTHKKANKSSLQAMLLESQLGDPQNYSRQCEWKNCRNFPQNRQLTCEPARVIVERKESRGDANLCQRCEATEEKRPAEISTKVKLPNLFFAFL